MRPKWLENSKKFHGFRTSLLTLINRFLIKNSLNMVEIFQSLFLFFLKTYNIKFLKNSES